jgi:MFS family permease
MTEAEANGGTLLGRMLGPYRVLRGNRNLQLLFGGQLFSSFGDWLYVLALGILAYEITGSATVVGVLTFARLLPYAALMPFLGILADRGNRKVIMISADLGRGACMLGLLFAGTEGRLWIAYPLVFLATAFSSLFKPAMSSVLPAIVGDEEKFALLHDLADKAYFKNTTLVTAANNMPVPSFPSLYASVISVASHGRTEDPYLFYYNPSPPVEFGAPGIDVRVAWSEGGWITATGNSFAAPHITGVVAKILGKHPYLTLFQMKTVLRALSANMARGAADRQEASPGG